MKEKELKFDRKRHILYSKHAKRVLRARLRQGYGVERGEDLWERTQLQYARYLEDMPDVGGRRNSHAAGIYDGLLFFAYYTILPEKPPLTELQPVTAAIFMDGFKRLGRFFDLNRRSHLRLAAGIFRRVEAADRRAEAEYPGNLVMHGEPLNRENSVIRYRFTRCPHADFAKSHGLEHIMPLLCNCDYTGMEYIHAGLIRHGTCMHGDRCDYCIVGDRHPLLRKHSRITDEQGFWVNE